MADQTCCRDSDSFSFSFSSRWHRSARKGPYALRPVSQQSPQGCPRNSTNICLVEHRSLSTLEGGMSAASFLHSSFLQAVNAVMLWLVRVEKVPQGKVTVALLRQGNVRGATRGVMVLPPMLLHVCRFESRLALESSGSSMSNFLSLVARGFLRVLRFPPLLHRFNGSTNKIKHSKQQQRYCHYRHPYPHRHHHNSQALYCAH